MPLPLIFPSRRHGHHRARATQIDAFHSVTDKQTKREKVYEAIKKLGEACDKDIAEYLDWERNCVVPRRFELVEDEKRVIESKRAKHPKTGVRVIYWKVA